MEEARNIPTGGARKVLCGSEIASTLCCWTDHGDEGATGGNPSGLCCQGHSSPRIEMMILRPRVFRCRSVHSCRRYRRLVNSYLCLDDFSVLRQSMVLRLCVVLVARWERGARGSNCIIGHAASTRWEKFVVGLPVRVAPCVAASRRVIKTQFNILLSSFGKNKKWPALLRIFPVSACARASATCRNSYAIGCYRPAGGF